MGFPQSSSQIHKKRRGATCNPPPRVGGVGGAATSASDIALLRAPPTVGGGAGVLQAGSCCRNPGLSSPVTCGKEGDPDGNSVPCRGPSSRYPDLPDRGRGSWQALILRKPLFLEGKFPFRCCDWLADKPCILESSRGPSVGLEPPTA